MKQMNAVEVNEFLSANADAVKIDVREAHELQNGMIDGAIHIAMQTIPNQLVELEKHKDTPIVLICRSGMRSDQVGQYLEQSGFNNVINLVGGMNAWASDVDNSMDVY